MEVDIIVEAILEKKGHEVVVMDFSGLLGVFFSTFVICHGTSAPQIDAVVENVERSLKKHKKLHPLHIEGKNNMEWVLMDYGNIVVHVFNEESRRFYNLEDLWADAKITRIDDKN